MGQETILRALAELADTAKKLVSDGVNDDDQYDSALSIIGMLQAIDDRDEDQEALLTDLYLATDVYEEKHYGYGN